MPVLSPILRVLTFGVVVGTAGSLFAIGFVEAIAWVNDALFVTADSRAKLAAPLSMWLFVIPAGAGLLAGLLLLLIDEKRPHNPADVIEAAQSGRGVSVKAGAVTAAAVVVGLGGGASVGQYGPLTHLGASLGTLISRWGKVEPALGIGCGVAAAISTAFSAPIAGIIFAHEVVLRHYSLRAFAPITVASSTGLFIADRVFHRPPLFEIEVARAVFAPEFLAFILIGALGALVAVIYMQGILTARAFAAKIAAPVWLKPAFAGLCVGIAAIWIPEILGVGQETLRAVITPAEYAPTKLAWILGAKIAATALCIGFGFAGGVFSPALLIGILFGALAGHAAQFIYPALHVDAHVDVHAGFAFYAICGLAAVTSPVIGAPLATILIVFELTRNYELTTAVMVSVVFSNLVAYRLFGRSLFDRELSLRGFDLSMGRDKVRLAQVSITDHLTTDFLRARPNDDLQKIKRALVAAKRSEVYVVDEKYLGGKYLGVITLNQIIAAELDRHATPKAKAGAKAKAKAKHLVRTDIVHFTADMSVWAAMEAMESFVGESIAVVDKRGNLLGVVYESTLVAAYLQTMHRLRAEEHAQ